MQILGVFYLLLAIILVGSNCGRRIRLKTGGEDMKNTVQVMEGKEVNCKVVEDKENIVFLEDEV